MANPIIRKLLDTIDLMRRAEEGMAAFYEACGARWERSAQFWHQLRDAERRHASALAEMAELVTANEALYAPGRPFNPIATQRFIEWTERSRREIQSEDAFLKDALVLALDMERSLIENRFTEVLSSQDPRFLQLAKLLRTETEAHVELIREKAAPYSLG